LGGIPYIVIGLLTHFRAEESTILQRFFTMLWLASSVAIGGLLPFFRLNVVGIQYFYLETGKNDSRSARMTLVWLVIVILFSLAAIGGFVVVGLLLVISNILTCSN